MDADRWAQVCAVFDRLADAAPAERPALLAELAPGDDELHREVAALLASSAGAAAFHVAPQTVAEPVNVKAAARSLPPQLGPYRLLDLLGAGGMGEVYRARDTRLDREVAVKVLPQHMADDPLALGRFRREAKAIASLSHPNIVSIFDFGRFDDTAYLVTELLEGETLRARLERGPMAWRQVCEVGAAVAEALAAAHSKGVIHRDVKPENIVITHEGRVKILDFGLARAERFFEDVDEDATARESTLPGTVVGSTGYMSPEQVTAGELQPTTDIFSLGCVLYEMVAGQRPFARGSVIQSLAAIVEADPPALTGAVPYELTQVIAHCLAKKPAERYQSAHDLAFTLSAMAQSASADSLLRDRRSSPILGSGSVSSSAARAALPAAHELPVPETRYTRSGDVNIAYQVVGSGELDLVFVMGWITHLEYFWREPSFARFLRRLASFSRLILFDKRGTGLSDRVPLDQLPTLEQRMDDVRAVLDAVGSERAALCGISEGGPMCSLFAATYPEKTTALVMIGTYAKRIWDPEYPWAPSLESRQRFFELMQREWGGPVGIAERAPSKASDPTFRDWWATYLRMGASPGAAVALTKMNAEVDIRAVLPTIRVPALVIHRAGDVCLKAEEGRYVASRIPGARYVELPGNDHLPFVGDQDAILDEVEEFLTGVRHGAEPDRILATILVLLPAGKAAEGLPAEQRAMAERELGWFRGRTLELDPGRVVATFDGPARAVRCATKISAALRRAGIDTVAGVHTGECDVAGDALRGLPIELAGEIAAAAAPGEVLVSSTVRDLVAGSGLDFEDRGATVFGTFGEWRLFSTLGP
jgi:serine/threonine protein kinase